MTSVSCLMPTSWKRRWCVPLAIQRFLDQTYSPCELVVVDEPDGGVRDLVPDHPRIRYVRAERRLRLGEKRNVAADEARGEVLVIWDDDDWHGPRRVEALVDRMLTLDIDLVGADWMIFHQLYDPRGTYVYRYQDRAAYVIGGSMAAKREVVLRHRYDPKRQRGEDTDFAFRACKALGPRAKALNGLIRHYVAFEHGAHAGHGRLYPNPPQWTPLPIEMRLVTNGDVDRYVAALRTREGV